MGKIVKYDGYFEDGYSALTGFISTSMDRKAAESFAWSSKDSGHQQTIFEIMWKYAHGYYVMDMSAFPDEQEVLLFDGSRFEVVSVTQTQHKGEVLNVIVLKFELYLD